ncbi:MAG: hypothetical protein Q8P86_01205 [bacterium]|nr:hypothetical protein [bacterium]
MEKIVIAVDTGSASKKYALYKNQEEVGSFHAESIKGEFFANHKSKNGQVKRIALSEGQYKKAILIFLSEMTNDKEIPDSFFPDAFGIRTVAPRPALLPTKIIDSQYMEELEVAKQTDPVHVNIEIEEIETLKKEFPNTPLYGVSDSAFHDSLPDVAKIYALPKEMRERFPRLGYHGLSVQSAVLKAEKILGGRPDKSIVVHLGGGASITAVRGGKSVDTSMGFTPLEGLPMSTRVGDIGAGTVLQIGQQDNLSHDDLKDIFWYKSGLLALGGSDDMRELIDRLQEGDADAELAVDFYCYNIRKYIGSYFAVLGGLDALVFTGTIGERSDFLRTKICEGLLHLGVEIDESKNKENVTDTPIGKGKVSVLVVATEEMKMLADEVLNRL